MNPSKLGSLSTNYPFLWHVALSCSTWYNSIVKYTTVLNVAVGKNQNHNLLVTCHMWEEVERRKVIRKLQTFSQIFAEMISFLRDHFTAKKCKTPEDSKVDEIKEQIDAHFKDISKIAFNGLVNNQLCFDGEVFESCRGAQRTACEVGILTEETGLSLQGYDHGSGYKRPRMASSVSFPHKLFQEFMAGLHLVEQFQTNHSEYEHVVSTVILPKAKEFQYLLYFATSQLASVGKDIVTKLTKTHSVKLDFVVEVAFESHDKETATLVETYLSSSCRNILLHKQMSAHVMAGYLYTLQQVEKITIYSFWQGQILVENAAEKICTLQTLRTLSIHERHDQIPASFLRVLAKHASLSKVETIDMEYSRARNKSLSESNSRNLGKCVGCMPCLKTVKLDSHVHDEFFSSIATIGNGSKVQSFTMKTSYTVSLSESSGRNLAAFFCSAPCLNSVNVEGGIQLGDGFFSAVASMAKQAQVQSFTMKNETGYTVSLSENSGRNLAAFFCSAPCLNNVTVGGHIELAEGFFSTMASMAMQAQVESFSMKIETRDTVSLSESSGRNLAAFFCSAPCLNSVNVGARIDLGDGFFSPMALNAIQAQIQSFTMETCVKLTENASRDLMTSLYSMPSLTSVGLGSIDPTSDFFSILASSAAKMNIHSFTMDNNVNADENLTESASRDLATSLCSMPSLTSVVLERLVPTSDFFSIMATNSHHLKIQSFTMKYYYTNNLTESASRDLATSLCSMPSLTSVVLERLVPTSDFFSIIATNSHNLKIQSFTMKYDKYSYKNLSDSELRDLATSLCSMPSLTSVVFEGLVPSSSDFFSTISSNALNLKIQSFSLRLENLNESTTRDLAKSLCSMPSLTNTVIDIKTIHSCFLSVMATDAPHLKHKESDGAWSVYGVKKHTFSRRDEHDV